MSEKQRDKVKEMQHVATLVNRIGRFLQSESDEAIEELFYQLGERFGLIVTR